jgi:hypothetical protein
MKEIEINFFTMKMELDIIEIPKSCNERPRPLIETVDGVYACLCV